ncbi:MAG TPA: glycogen debranching N-terminal domain-containing protein [Solirubrobacteraceae bacterium]|nr:glycogen debranching N-terminal domain-containing protein [Solirubrobacteraceae bacterium]
MIKDGDLFLRARTDGDIAPARVSGEGFYAYDTRCLSEVRLEVGGARPVALSCSTVDEHAVVDSTNARASAAAHRGGRAGAGERRVARVVHSHRQR